MGCNVNDENRYKEDLEAFQLLYSDQASKRFLIEKLAQFYNKHSKPEYKSHFLFLLAVIFDEVGNKKHAYKILLEAATQYPATVFGTACSDASKNMFIELSGKVEQIPTFPISIQVEPTNNCNLQCIMCGRSDRRSSGNMSFENFEKIVDQSLSAGAVRVCLYNMGEPLLNPDIVNFVSYFKKQADKLRTEPPCLPREVHIQTNGALLSGELSNSLMKAGLDHLSFSIDGATPEKFEEIRKGASFSKVVGNLSKASIIRDENRYPTRLSVSVLDLGLDLERDTPGLNQFYKKHGADAVYFTHCSDTGFSESSDMTIFTEASKHETQGQCEEIESNQKSTVIEPTAGVPLARNLLDRLTVLWNGDIQYTCGEPSNVIGNIEAISLEDAYKVKMESLGFNLA